jgi:hypothetical protein
VLDDILLAEPGEADVVVRNGIVTLSPRTGPHGDLIPLALQLMWDVDGVVDIVDRLDEPGPIPREHVPVPRQADPPTAEG